MKPGLRKVAALILATATLFGSGASAVSAAYADDTTMGTSTLLGVGLMLFRRRRTQTETARHRK